MPDEPVVRVGRGTVRGSFADGVAAFKGIPYAEAPAGPGRFAAPRPAWLAEDFDATRFGPSAPQVRRDAPGMPDLTAITGPGWVSGPGYLNLNVWTPDPGAGGLPVLVFIHGGAFVSGAASSAGYDGTRFARHGAVLVTINYRLGVPGFLRLRGAPDNRGLRDQILALEWVAEHIAAFGGDPGNVTVFGESAGALSIGALLAAAPPGLFRRAISQSGGASHALSAAQADIVTEALARRLGVPATVEAFSALPDESLSGALAQLSAAPPDLAVDGARDPLMGLTKVGPVVDGELLTGQPVDAIAAGAAAQVDLLAGVNSEEMNLYLVALPAPSVTEPMLRTAVAALHPDPAALVSAYRSAGRGATPAELLSAIGTDYMFAIPTLRLADAHAAAPAGTWRYEFTWRSPAFGGRLGACHGAELPFVFDNVGRVDYGALEIPASDETRTLASEMHQAWLAFARDGDPGWPRYEHRTPNVRRFGHRDPLTTTPDGAERQVWQGIR